MTIIVADQCPFIEAFFRAVFGRAIDASELPMEVSETHPTLMINPRIFDFLELVERIERYFGLPKSYCYKDLSGVRSTALGRPTEQYAFAHFGWKICDMPGISYKKAKTEKMYFLDETEYTLATAYNKWLHGSWLDVSGWTRLDALWADEQVAFGSWDEGRLYYCWNSTVDDYAYGGLRRIIMF